MALHQVIWYGMCQKTKTKNKNFGFVVGCKKPSMILVKLKMLFTQTRLWCYQCNINTIRLNQLELYYLLKSFGKSLPFWTSILIYADIFKEQIKKGKNILKFSCIHPSSIQWIHSKHHSHLSWYTIFHQISCIGVNLRYHLSCFPSYTFRHPRAKHCPLPLSVKLYPLLAFIVKTITKNTSVCCTVFCN